MNSGLQMGGLNFGTDAIFAPIGWVGDDAMNAVLTVDLVLCSFIGIIYE